MSKLLITQYHNEVEKIKRYGGSKNESTIRVAFQNLLNNYCQTRNFLLIPELPYKNQRIIPDGTIKDALQLDWGYWESKDENDDLDLEIEKKFAKGYPNDNILFEDSHTAILIQSGVEKMRISMQDVDALDKILKEFIDYQRPEVAEFYQAITKFKEDLPTLINTLRENIDLASKNNQKFIAKRDTFFNLCQNSINPNITIEDVREMMIQHILTEDIFLTIFDEAQFHRDNNIARELTDLIDSFLKGGERKKLLSSIQHYYKAIKSKASQINNHHEKQKFLKAIYENFYKAYNPLSADRLGIVYTPNEIVRFMIESTDFLLHKHFHKLLIDKDVEILDPATGTGTFITELIEYLPINSQNCDALRYKYQHEIHCNEVAILPYYIANLNIEYTYQQKTGEYQEFNNICFVDTLDHTSFEGKQMDLFAMSLENTARIKRQNDKKISVIIGNPPYNAKQENFNDNNANRSYESIDKRIKSTYIKEGKAQNQIVLYDMYVRFIRWASDRLNDNGIIAFITNNSFIDGLTFDGFRKVLREEFSHIYIIDLGGNIRQGDKTGNVFNIMIGVAITFLVRKDKNVGVEYHSTHTKPNNCEIYYYKSVENSVLDKLDFIGKNKLKDINFTHIIPKNNHWINQCDNDFDDLLPLIDKEVKSGKSEEAIFKLFSSGLKTQRDEWVYDFNKNNLEKKVRFLIDIYQESLNDKNFKDKNRIKWDRELTKYLDRKIEKEFNSEQILLSLSRPFIKQYLYFDKHFNGMTYQWFNIHNQEDSNNKYINFLVGKRLPFSTLISDKITSLGLFVTDAIQCLPLYTYDKEGKKEENITDWALELFREHYSSHGVTRGLSPLPESEESPLPQSSPLPQNSPLPDNPSLSEHWWLVTFVTHNSRVSERMITYGVKKGEPLIFNEENRIFIAEKILESVKNYNLNVITFNVLPDHVHLIIGANTEKELSENIRKIKGFTSFQFQRFNHWEKGQKIWAQKFHREVIEEESHLLNAIEYIENNHLKHSENWGEEIIATWENHLKIIVEETKKLTRGLSPLPKSEESPLLHNSSQKLITKEDIFYYVYAVLHNPKYREKYELNLKREFPKIPFYDNFWQWVNWGKKLMDLHLNYEKIEPYNLKRIDVALSRNSSPKRQEEIKAKLKADKVKHQIIIDEMTILTEIPPIAWEYKLGNRSALEWILDQYKEKKPRDKTIAERFNNYRFAEYKEKVIDLLMRVTTVSVETMKIINEIDSKNF
ncbi:transposase [Cyanobacterium aponinum FACHB-4101]|uniref:type ISP restriction/modification enzyme n=1 Tax=Cyanobacterium aponinum TaxID=379064 RepID=UPI001680D0A5|nr:type ISP restriction/modification enzyme [Cyanobacterium aponinum]MBD2393974.1 transposase [Cyanobacterium aponinum FACHB-4101]